jgi:hypothetical protein
MQVAELLGLFGYALDRFVADQRRIVVDCRQGRYPQGHGCGSIHRSILSHDLGSCTMLPGFDIFVVRAT